jgi:peptidoglycan-N-acetylglucosamine deacetylase
MTNQSESNQSDKRTYLSRRALLLGSAACGICALGGYQLGARREVSNSARTNNHGKTVTNNQRAAAQPNGLFFVATSEPVVALSLDDGPDPLYTPQVLEVLTKWKASATFFHVGVNAAVGRDLVKRVLDSGHSIGNHTFDHHELELLTPELVQQQIEMGQKALMDAGVPRPKLFRPPKGYTDEAVGILADANKYQTVFWDVCIERFVNHQPVAEGVEKLLARIRPGSIILGHDGGRIEGSGRKPLLRSRTMQALPLLLRGLADQGIEVVDVPTLMSRATPAAT